MLCAKVSTPFSSETDMMPSMYDEIERDVRDWEVSGNAKQPRPLTTEPDCRAFHIHSPTLGFPARCCRKFSACISLVFECYFRKFRNYCQKSFVFSLHVCLCIICQSSALAKLVLFRGPFRTPFLTLKIFLVQENPTYQMFAAQT